MTYISFSFWIHCTSQKVSSLIWSLMLKTSLEQSIEDLCWAYKFLRIMISIVLKLWLRSRAKEKNTLRTLYFEVRTYQQLDSVTSQQCLLRGTSTERSSHHEPIEEDLEEGVCFQPFGKEHCPLKESIPSLFLRSQGREHSRKLRRLGVPERMVTGILVLL